jgi:hypothetical protein
MSVNESELDDEPQPVPERAKEYIFKGESYPAMHDALFAEILMCEKTIGKKQRDWSDVEEFLLDAFVAIRRVRPQFRFELLVNAKTSDLERVTEPIPNDDDEDEPGADPTAGSALDGAERGSDPEA